MDDAVTQIEILKSLANVGASKAVGYLPIRTIEVNLKTNCMNLTKKYESDKLKARVFLPDETFIKGGALFVYDLEMVENIFLKHRLNINRLKWPASADKIVEKLASKWYQKPTELVIFIRELYGESS